MNAPRQNDGDDEVTPSDPAACSFEESLARLEAIARDLEEGELGLDAALSRYEQGVAHLRECRKMLQLAERKIELLLGVNEAGEAITTPFDDGPTHDPANPAALASADASNSRAKRRSAPKVKRPTVVGENARTSEAPVSQVDASKSEASEVATSKVEPSKVEPSKVDVDSPKRLF